MTMFDTLVAAGGYGTRACADKPKSLILVDGTPLLVFTIRSALEAGGAAILVVTNRPDFKAEYEEIAGSFNNVELRYDDGFSSTFLLNQAYAHEMSDGYMFLYGHSPRLSSEIRCVKKANCQSVATYNSSSRRLLLKYDNDLLEPPFYLDRSSVMKSKVANWRLYFNDIIETTNRVSFADAPSEPNTMDEIEEYVAYYKKKGLF